MAYPPALLPTNRTDATPQQGNHIADHNGSAAAINDISAHVQGIDSGANKVGAAANADYAAVANYANSADTCNAATNANWATTSGTANFATNVNSYQTPNYITFRWDAAGGGLFFKVDNSGWYLITANPILERDLPWTEEA